MGGKGGVGCGCVGGGAGGAGWWRAARGGTPPAPKDTEFQYTVDVKSRLDNPDEFGSIIIKDDTGAADQTKRLATELVVNDKVAVLGGFGLTPLALSVGPVATQAKVPAVIMAAGTSTIVATSPYFVRTSFTLPQNTTPMAQWSAANGIKTVVTLVSDYGPGLDSEKAFKAEFEAKGGKVIESLRAPLANPEFAAFLQKAKDLKPDALFLFVPSGQGASLMKQVGERELAKAGIKIIGTGDVTDDDQLNGMGDALIGMITSHNYSAAHDSPENKAYVSAFLKATNNNWDLALVFLVAHPIVAMIGYGLIAGELKRVVLKT